MTENLKTVINEFIINAALNKEPVFDAYRKLCKLQKDPNIDYVDFEWKYFQYLHGNRDLTIERSSENSSPLTFSGMPMDVLEKVVGKLDLRDCLRLRKVSRDFRNLLDSTEIHCEAIQFDFPFDIVIENSRIKYWENLYGDCEISVSHLLQKAHYYDVEHNARAAMIADAAAILQNPKLKIGWLEIRVSDVGKFPEFLEFLKSLNFQLNVRSFHFNTINHSVLPILKLLKPKALEEINLRTSRHGFLLDGIEETSQWKMAKKLYWSQFPDRVPIEEMLHFKNIRINGFEFSDNNLIMVRDILLKSAHLASCSLEADDLRRWVNYYDSDDDDDEGGVHVNVNRIMSELPAFDPKTRRMPIPNSQEHFQLKYWTSGSTNYLVIKRTTDKLRIEEFFQDAVRSHRPVYWLYKLFCKREENLATNYVDFEWKYYQYYHGNRDLTLERSPNNSSPVTFSDLPKNVLKEVVGNFNLAERLALRNVSRDLRDLLDSTEVHCERMRLIFRDDRPEIWLPDDVSHFHQVTIAVALSLLKNPSLKIGHVDFVVLRRPNISEFLNLFNFQLNARSVSLSVREADCIRRILEFLKSRTLEEISFTNSLDLTADQFNEIADTEQWKEAIKLKCWCFSDAFQMKKMLHFKEINIKWMLFDNANLVKVRDILLKSTHLERCYLSRHPNGYYGNEAKINGIMSQDPRFDSLTRRCSIPNSRDYFQSEFKKDEYGVCALSIKRVSQ